jgi:hypothetical protein
VGQAAAAAAVAPAIGALCISYTGPGLVQTLSDFEECLRKYNWLNNQPDSSPVGVGDPEDAWEGLQPTSQKSTALGTRLVTCTTTSGSVDQWWKVLPRRSRDQTQATRGVNDPPQGQLACLVLLPLC